MSALLLRQQQCQLQPQLHVLQPCLCLASSRLLLRPLAAHQVRPQAHQPQRQQ
jgi:hypothetical protein